MKQETNKLGLRLENTYTGLPPDFFTETYPDKVPNPEPVIINEKLARELGLEAGFLKTGKGLGIFSGNEVSDEAVPIAQAYAGHQFGYFTMLGDGRAILLGEYVTPEGERLDIQLKGSGRTAYSRGGDGKAALGPMLREYIISEGMKGLGIPTTRSLAVLTTGEGILRETVVPGAILVRTAKSHIRVGTFEYASHLGDRQKLKALADYTLWRHYPRGSKQENPYLYLLHRVVERQAVLIAKWQSVGFIHGVMNTDNMAVSGESIDYGPCAFMDVYHPDTVFSSIDEAGRYSYRNQPVMAAWNLARFSETLLPLLDDNVEAAVRIAEKEVGQFATLYHRYWLKEMRRKLGLFHEKDEDGELVDELLQIMYQCHADYTNTFRRLTMEEDMEGELADSDKFRGWFVRWQKRRALQRETWEESGELMKKSNPTVIPRNERVEEAIAEAVSEGDYSMLKSFVHVLQNPFDYKKRNRYYETVSGKCGSGYKTFCGT